MIFTVISRQRIDDESGTCVLVTFGVLSKRYKKDTEYVRNGSFQVFVDADDSTQYDPGVEFELALNKIESATAN